MLYHVRDGKIVDNLLSTVDNAQPTDSTLEIVDIIAYAYNTGNEEIPTVIVTVENGSVYLVIMLNLPQDKIRVSHIGYPIDDNITTTDPVILARELHDIAVKEFTYMVSYKTIDSGTDSDSGSGTDSDND